MTNVQDELPTYAPAPYVRIQHPDWSRSASIYQIHTRQFTTEGTFRAAQVHLPRLRELGVSILWLMPVREIGRKNRKGTLGSPYAVRDYYGVAAELGTMEDLKNFVGAAHEHGMYVLLDWVANHTAWDCNLVTEHPEWYARDWKGDFRPTPWWDWVDVIDLDCSQPELRRYMTRAMRFWVEQADIDGRCDVAGFVPVDFWNRVRAELDEIKPVFMLAEWESRDLHAAAFDMTYARSWSETLHRIAKGAKGLDQLRADDSWSEKDYPPKALRVTFVSNHDKNACEGAEFEQFGDSLEAAVVLSVVGEGLPLISSGQQAGNDKRLEFFERDPIVWRDHPTGELYRRLFGLKRDTRALWNAPWGARMIDVPNNSPATVFSFVRRSEHDRVFAVFNFSPGVAQGRFRESLCQGKYVDLATGAVVTVNEQSSFDLASWDVRVLVDRAGQR